MSPMKTHDPKPYRTGVSISVSLYIDAKKRQEELGMKSFSAYLESLIKRDISGPSLTEDDIERIAARLTESLYSDTKAKKG